MLLVGLKTDIDVPGVDVDIVAFDDVNVHVDHAMMWFLVLLLIKWLFLMLALLVF